MKKMASEVKEHLLTRLIPFWKGLRDDQYGGYYGWMSEDLTVDKKAVKGCILNSRITWFFSNAYLLLGEESLLEEARHAYAFMQDYCIDREKGGVYWSLTYDGVPEDTTKHTYNQAFAIYALSSFYDASGDPGALETAFKLFELIEERCKDEIGYKEAFTRDFQEMENDKLSENGVIADRTMNTLLHVFEAYTELYRVSGDLRVKQRLLWILDTVEKKVYNPKLCRQEVFFDKEMRSILDLHSYGHDIEAAWLFERGLEILKDEDIASRMRPIILALTGQVYESAFDGHSLANECEKGVVEQSRIWWVQAESVVGFLNGYAMAPEHGEYLEAAKAQWDFIRKYLVDSREEAEWHWRVSPQGEPDREKPIVEPWKCPYHNGRMCFEVIKRADRLSA